MTSYVGLRAAYVELARRACYSSLAAYARAIWPVANPGRPLVWTRHMTALCIHLEAWIRGDIRRLIVNVPPGHSKSFLVSICAPTWAWLEDPTLRILGSSYDMVLSRKLNDERRNVLESDVYRNFLGAKFRHAKGNWGKDRFVNTERGWMRAVSTKSGVTGDHCDLMIVDDPLKPDDVWGPNLEGHVSWFDETASSRFGDLKSARICIVMQRIHNEDLTGILVEREPENWDVLCLPAEYDPERHARTSLGWEDWRTTPGELLCPERFPADVVAQMKVRMGSAAFAGQYNQTPTVGQGRMFDSSWWQRWDRLPEKIDAWLGSIDATFGETETDYVVIQIWARSGNCAYLVAQHRQRLEFQECLDFLIGPTDRQTGGRDKTKGFVAKYPQCTHWLIERAANGAAIVSSMKRAFGSRYHVQSVVPEESKQARAAACAPIVESRHVYVPEGVEWVKWFIKETKLFPQTKHNDQVDAMTQALNHWRDVLGVNGYQPELTDITEPMGPPSPRRATFKRWGGKGQHR